MACSWIWSDWKGKGSHGWKGETNMKKFWMRTVPPVPSARTPGSPGLSFRPFTKRLWNGPSNGSETNESTRSLRGKIDSTAVSHMR